MQASVFKRIYVHVIALLVKELTEQSIISVVRCVFIEFNTKLVKLQSNEQMVTASCV